jgi:hypothetical protein
MLHNAAMMEEALNSNRRVAFVSLKADDTQIALLRNEILCWKSIWTRPL